MQCTGLQVVLTRMHCSRQFSQSFAIAPPPLCTVHCHRFRDVRSCSSMLDFAPKLRFVQSTTALRFKIHWNTRLDQKKKYRKAVRWCASLNRSLNWLIRFIWIGLSEFWVDRIDHNYFIDWLTEWIQYIICPKSYISWLKISWFKLVWLNISQFTGCHPAP